MLLVCLCAALPSWANFSPGTYYIDLSNVDSWIWDGSSRGILIWNGSENVTPENISGTKIYRFEVTSYPENDKIYIKRLKDTGGDNDYWNQWDVSGPSGSNNKITLTNGSGDYSWSTYTPATEQPTVPDELYVCGNINNTANWTSTTPVAMTKNGSVFTIDKINVSGAGDNCYIGFTTDKSKNDDANTRYGFSAGGQTASINVTYILNLKGNGFKVASGNYSIKVDFSDASKPKMTISAPVEVQSVATPVIAQSGNTVTISCATEGASIQYKLGNGSWQTYSAPFALTESCTVYAKATKSGMSDSAETSLACTYTAPLSAPEKLYIYGHIEGTDGWNNTGSDNTTYPLTKNGNKFTGTFEIYQNNQEKGWFAFYDGTNTYGSNSGGTAVNGSMAMHKGNADSWVLNKDTYDIVVDFSDPSNPTFTATKSQGAGGTKTIKVLGNINGYTDWNTTTTVRNMTLVEGTTDTYVFGPFNITGGFKIWMDDKYYGYDNITDDSKTYVTSWDGDNENIGYNGSEQTNMFVEFDASTKAIKVYKNTEQGYTGRATLPVKDGYKRVYFVKNEDNTGNFTTTNCYLYAYNNERASATNSEKNAEFPGLPLSTDNNAVDRFVLVDSDVIGYNKEAGDILYGAYINTMYDMFIVADGNGEGHVQSHNFAIEDNGVYFISDERTPFGQYTYDDESNEENTASYDQYLNVSGTQNPTYIYIPASEFGDKLAADENGVVLINIHQEGVNAEGQTVNMHKTGINGTTQMFRVEYNGVAYYRFPSVNMDPEKPMTIEMVIKTSGDIDYNTDKWGDDNKGSWTVNHGDYVACKDEDHADDRHVGCSDETRVFTYTGEVAYVDGGVYHRNGSITTILSEVTPDVVKLHYVDAEGETQEVEATEHDDEGVYYFGDTKIGEGKNFWYTVEYTNSGNSYKLSASRANRPTSVSTPYSFTMSTTDNNQWVSPTKGSASKQFYPRLDWLNQQVYSVPVRTNAFILNGFVRNFTVDAKAKSGSGSYDDAEGVLDILTHDYFNDESAHFGKTIVRVRPAASHEAIKNNAGFTHVDVKGDDVAHNGTLQVKEANSTEYGQVHLAAYTAGVYTVQIEYPQSTLFERSYTTSTMTVRPTIESLDVQLNFSPITKGANGEYQLEEFNPNFKYEHTDGAIATAKKAFIECGPGFIGKSSEGVEPGTYATEIAKAYDDNKVKFYFKIDDPKEGTEPKMGPNRVVSRANEVIDDPESEGYTDVKKADGPNSFDLTKAYDSQNGGFNLIMEENGVKSAPVHVNVSNAAYIPTGVEDVETAEDAETVWYDLQGNRVVNPDKGIYIKVTGNKAEKVML